MAKIQLAILNLQTNINQFYIIYKRNKCLLKCNNAQTYIVWQKHGLPTTGLLTIAQKRIHFELGHKTDRQMDKRTDYGEQVNLLIKQLILLMQQQVVNE